MKKNRDVLFLLLILQTGIVFAEKNGTDYFRTNKPEKAIPLLEAELAGENPDPSLYNYLGIAYYQTGNYEKSLQIFEQGLNASGTDKKILAYNAGNTAFAGGDYETAVSYYSLAVAADPQYAPAVLNRGNALLRENTLDKALEDYKNFIVIAPDDPQKTKVEMIINLISKQIADNAAAEQKMAEEQQRLAAESERLKQAQATLAAAQEAAQKQAAAEAAAAEAVKQQAAAEAAAAEAERRRKLLEDVTNSLQQTDTTNMSAGTEDVIDYDSEDAELD